ncbi:MAG: GtrA family protein [Patescibacteria group bacterium]|nr:GtrA family protein [Patescibacteria group bacterium]
MITWSKNKYFQLDSEYPRLTRIGRFVVSGGSATLLNMLSVLFFNEVLHLWYILSATLAFLLGSFVSFVLQKFWTFREHSKEHIKFQLFLFLITIGGGMLVNALLVYGMVHYWHWHYLLAQIVSGVIIAVTNYKIYRKLVFNGAFVRSLFKNGDDEQS